MEYATGRRAKVLWTLLIISLVMNVFSLVFVLLIRQAMITTFHQARLSLHAAQSSSIDYNLRVKQTLPFSTTVPIDQSFVIPLHTTLPVDTTVNINPNLGVLGNPNIPVPIKADVPVNLEIPIHVQQTVPIQSDVPVDITVPITIRLGETGAGQVLLDLDTGLAQAERWLGAYSAP